MAASNHGFVTRTSSEHELGGYLSRPAVLATQISAAAARPSGGSGSSRRATQKQLWLASRRAAHTPHAQRGRGRAPDSWAAAEAAVRVVRVDGNHEGAGPRDNRLAYRQDRVAQIRESQVAAFGRPLNYTVSGLTWRPPPPK